MTKIFAVAADDHPMNGLRLGTPRPAGGGTALQQELSDVTAELSKCVSRLRELSARKARLELRVMVGQ